MNRRVMMIAAVLFLSTGLAAWADVSGRDAAADGQRQVLTGTLVQDGIEWELKTKDQTYALRLGPLGADAGKVFKDGAQATVTGFVSGTDVAPITVSTGGASLSFWTESRQPSWAGDGRGRGRGRNRGRMDADEDRPMYGRGGR